MNFYSQKTVWKLLLLAGAVIIGFSSLIYTHNLVRQLSVEELKKVELWAKATRKLSAVEVTDTIVQEEDFALLFEMIENNNTVPVILAEKNLDTISTRNLRSRRLNNPQYVQRQLDRMMSRHDPIVITLWNGEEQFIYYKDSIVLTKLKYFPFIQLAVIILFIAVSYLAFSASRRAEQNRVWVGLTKETAHQLGTPTSSLLAWLELLKMKKADQATVYELEKDVKRLEKIADRFSKIGSRPVLELTNPVDIIRNTIQYLRNRSPEKVTFEIKAPERISPARMNAGLFEWVLENLCKNAIDAMGGDGRIHILLSEDSKHVIIDVMDEGKGIPNNLYRTIFKPGYTSKPRGWGLGLSLSKRIIENYHNGKIFVLNSEPGKGSTIRIMVRR